MQQLAATPGGLDRIVLCLTDVQSPDLMIAAGLPTPITYAQGVAAARNGLAGLAQEQRDKIAYKNLLRLLRLS